MERTRNSSAGSVGDALRERYRPRRRLSSGCCGDDRERRYGAYGHRHNEGGWELPGDLAARRRSEEHTSELQSRLHLVCRLLLEKKKNKETIHKQPTL